MGSTSDVRNVLIRAWCKKLTVNQWATEMAPYLRQPGSSDLLAESFIELLGECSTSSRLLCSYLEYALSNHIIIPAMFFNQLAELSKPEKQEKRATILLPSIFCVYLQVIEKFFPSLRINNQLFNDQEKGLEVYLNVSNLLANAILYSVTSVQEEGNTNEHPLNERVVGNINKSLTLLTEMSKNERTKGMILIAKAIHYELWDSFYAQVEKIHELFVGSEHAEYLEQLRPNWMSFCHSISMFIHPLQHIVRTLTQHRPVYSMLQSATAINCSASWNPLTFAIQYEISCRQFRHEHDTVNTLASFKDVHQWTTAEFYTNLFAATLQTENQLYKKHLKNSKTVEWTRCRWFLLVRLPLLIEQWEALESGPSVYRHRRHLHVESDEQRAYYYHTGSQRKQQQAPFYQLQHELNNIEQALVHISYFPSLFIRHVPEKAFPPTPAYHESVLELIIVTFESYGLISREQVYKRLKKTVEYTAHIVSRADIDQLILSTRQKISEFEQAEMEMEGAGNKDDLGGKLDELIERFCDIDSRQEVLLNFVMDLLRPPLLSSSNGVSEPITMDNVFEQDREASSSSSSSSSSFSSQYDTDLSPVQVFIVSRILQKLSTITRSLYIFYLHHSILTLIDFVCFYCETLGRIYTVGSEFAAVPFSSVFFFVLLIIDKFEIKDGRYNQKVFIKVVSKYPYTFEWYSRYIHSFFNDTVPRHFTRKEVEDLGRFFSQTDDAPDLNLSDFIHQNYFPWQILLCAPVKLYDFPLEHIKTKYHQRIVDMCREFYPAVISLNEIYNPTLEYLTQAEHVISPRRGSLAKTSYLIDNLLDSVSLLNVKRTFELLLSEKKRENKQGFYLVSSTSTFVSEIKGSPSFTDFLSNVTSEINALFSALLSGSLSLSHKLLTMFHMLLWRIGKREFVAMMLKESIVLASKSSVGYGAAYAIRAAELGGSIVGICGPDVVAELLTQNLPLFVPVISTTVQAQMVAYFTWAACRISQIFSVNKEALASYSPIVGAAQIHSFRFFTELLERQCRAPAPVLALPITFFSLVATTPHVLNQFGSIQRVAQAIKKLHSSSICAGLFDFSTREGRRVAFSFYCSFLN